MSSAPMQDKIALTLSRDRSTERNRSISVGDVLDPNLLVLALLTSVRPSWLNANPKTAPVGPENGLPITRGWR
jgi:hypothetical protein